MTSILLSGSGERVSLAMAEIKQNPRYTKAIIGRLSKGEQILLVAVLKAAAQHGTERAIKILEEVKEDI